MTTRLKRSRPVSGAIVTLCALSLGALLPACDRSPAPPVDAPETQASTNTHSYTVRGRIRMMPDPGNPMAEFQIRHEHIPTYIGWDGALHVNADGVPGMKSMTMPFPVEDPSLLTGFEAGDIIEFTFITDLDEHRFWISSMTQLDDDTELDFSVKIPPAQNPSPEPEPEGP